ncbi:MAG: four helix bundle protein [Flavobacteriales bacterium]
MATITTFEGLSIWQKARELCKVIWALTQKDKFAKDFGLKDQINRSSGSCMDNIAEGFERDGTKEFVQFLSISKGSIGETRSQLYRALDRGHITQEEFDQAFYMCKDESKDIGNFMRYLRSTDIKGNKYPRKPSAAVN